MAYVIQARLCPPVCSLWAWGIMLPHHAVMLCYNVVLVANESHVAIRGIP